MTKQHYARDMQNMTLHCLTPLRTPAYSRLLGFFNFTCRGKKVMQTLNSWKDIPIKGKAGFFASIIALGVTGWFASDIYIVTHAEADEAHQKIARWHLADVRLQIETKEALKVETKYRADLGQRAKDELITLYDVKLKRLRNTEKCLTEGRVDCE